MCPPRGGRGRGGHASCPYERVRRRERQHLPCAPERQARERGPLWPSASRPAGWHPPRYRRRRWAPRFVGGNPAQGGLRGPSAPVREKDGPMPCVVFGTVQGDCGPIGESEMGEEGDERRRGLAGSRRWLGCDGGHAGGEVSSPARPPR